VSILLALSPAPAGIVISGALVAQAATVAGTVVDGSTLTGALSAQASAASGAVVVSDAGITSSGSLVAQASSASGTVVGGSTISGALASQSSTASGVVVGGSTLSGALAAQAAQVSGAVTARWLLHSPDVFLLENGVDKYQLEDLSGFYQREEIALQAEAAQVSGTLVVSGFIFTPYIPPKRPSKKAVAKSPKPEQVEVAVTVSAPIELAEPISYALEIDALSEAGESVERVLADLDELRELVHKEVARKRKRRKRILALITIQ
jgi:hypothetical protein